MVIRIREAKKFGHRYPWEEWFSKPRFKLVRGRDFTCRVHGMAQMVRNAAASAKIRRRVSVEIGDNFVKVTVGERL